MSEHRLIDANEAKELICGIDSEFAKFVDDIPTAYDTDKVVEQLDNSDVGTMFCSQCKYVKECETIADEMIEKYELNDRVDLCAMVMKTKAIEIVKKGGLE